MWEDCIFVALSRELWTESEEWKEVKKKKRRKRRRRVVGVDQAVLCAANPTIAFQYKPKAPETTQHITSQCNARKRTDGK